MHLARRRDEYVFAAMVDVMALGSKAILPAGLLPTAESQGGGVAGLTAGHGPGSAGTVMQGSATWRLGSRSGEDGRT